MVGVPPLMYAGHSFHIGAVSTVTLCEVKDSTIKFSKHWVGGIVRCICTTLKLPGAALSHYSQLLVLAFEGQDSIGGLVLTISIYFILQVILNGVNCLFGVFSYCYYLICYPCAYELSFRGVHMGLG